MTQAERLTALETAVTDLQTAVTDLQTEAQHHKKRLKALEARSDATDAMHDDWVRQRFIHKH